MENLHKKSFVVNGRRYTFFLSGFCPRIEIVEQEYPLMTGEELEYFFSLGWENMVPFDDNHYDNEGFYFIFDNEENCFVYGYFNSNHKIKLLDFDCLKFIDGDNQNYRPYNINFKIRDGYHLYKSRKQSIGK